MQRWRCKDCGHVWESKRIPPDWVGRAYAEYSAGRRTLNELALRYGRSTRTLRRHFDRHMPVSPVPVVPEEAVALTFDATFFGRGYGLMVYRARGRNIHWQEIESETLAVVEGGLRRLTAQGWRFSSVTIDGRKGVIQLIKRLLPETPIQLCLFHQKAIVRRYLTSRPKTLCGQEIRELASFLAHIDEETFTACIADIKNRYGGFLKERNEQGQFKHRRLRSALRSLTTNTPYLYTWKRLPNLCIPTTTNSCDGSFAHWKAKVKIHRGLRQHRRSKMIETLLAQT